MKLAWECHGDGPPLVLLHGWGLHAGVWSELAAALAPHYRVCRVDLPGHGASPPVGSRLIDWAEAVASEAPEGAAWLGWSLGGLVAIAAAAAGGVERLILVDSTPRFTTGPDWRAGVASQVLAGFADDLLRDPRGTVTRFVSLQAMGSERARDEARRLRAGLYERGDPDPGALRAGLAMLAESDLRGPLSGLTIPVRWIHGARDRLVPPAAAHAAADLVPDGRVALIDRAGHAPFISHPEPFAGELEQAIRD